MNHWSSWSSPATRMAIDGWASRPGPPGLLPHRRDRAGEAVEHAGVEPADVDAELERGGGDDAPQIAVEQLALDLASLAGEVAAAVRPHLRCQVGGQLPPDVGRDQLGALATATEGDGAMAAPHELGDHAGRLAVGRRCSDRPASTAGIPQHEEPLAAGRAVVGDLGHRRRTAPRPTGRARRSWPTRRRRWDRSRSARRGGAGGAAGGRRGCRRCPAACGARRSRRSAAA